MFRLARKRGIGLIVGDQIPNLEHAVVRGNLGLKIMFRLSDYGAVQLYSRALGLTVEQQTALLNLPPRVVLVHHPSVPKPFLVRIPELRFRELTPDGLAEHRRRSRETLGLSREPEPRETGPVALLAPPDTDPPSQEILTHDQERYLAALTRDPMLSATARDKRLGISTRQGTAWRKQFRDLGLITEHTVRAKRRGRPIKIFALTTNASEYLTRRKVDFAPMQGNGGPVHQWWQYVIRTSLAGDG